MTEHDDTIQEIDFNWDEDLCQTCEPWEGRGEWEEGTTYNARSPWGEPYKIWHGETRSCNRKAEGELVSSARWNVAEPHGLRAKMCWEHAKPYLERDPDYYWLSYDDQKWLERLYNL